MEISHSAIKYINKPREHKMKQIKETTVKISDFLDRPFYAMEIDYAPVDIELPIIKYGKIEVDFDEDIETITEDMVTPDYIGPECKKGIVERYREIYKPEGTGKAVLSIAMIKMLPVKIYDHSWKRKHHGNDPVILVEKRSWGDNCFYYWRIAKILAKIDGGKWRFAGPRAMIKFASIFPPQYWSASGAIAPYRMTKDWSPTWSPKIESSKKHPQKVALSEIHTQKAVHYSWPFLIVSDK